MTHPRRYLVAWLLTILAVVGLVAAFNALVDPYGLFRIVRVEGFNALKARASARGGVFKRNGAALVRPRGLILGNSRAEIGFDPQHPAWPADARPTYNLALPGSGIATALYDLERMLRRSPPTVVVLGLEFLDFRTDPSAGDAKLPEPDAPWKEVTERVSALLTLGALGDSVATVRAQRATYSAGLTDTGFNPLRDYIQVARQEGYHAMFHQRDRENARGYVLGPKGVSRADGRPGPDFAILERIMALCTQHGVVLRLVLYPYHNHSLVLFQRAGLWPAFEAWKRTLVDLVRTGGGDHVELWDFSGPSPFSAETVPPPGDTRTEMKWYWEAGHFKKALGDRILSRVLHDGGVEWGMELSVDNIDAVLRQQRDDLGEYERTHPQDVADLERMIAAATRKP